MLKSIALAAAVALSAAAVDAAPVTTVTLPGSGIFPESMTSTRNGDLYVGSSGNGGVYRAKAGSSAAILWLDPAKTGLKSVLGVFPDEKQGLLFVCSVSPQGVPRDLSTQYLYGFDLKTAAQKVKVAMPDPTKAVCNDMDIGKDGALYVTDTGTKSIFRLAKGGSKLEPWITDDKLAGIDGIATAGDGFYANSVTARKLFHIAVGADGKAGAITELKPSLPLAGPDGMRRTAANRFLLAENSATVGRISEVTVNGDQASVRVIKEDPGVTAMTLVGNTVWIDNARFAYRPGQPKANEDPGPFVVYSAPLR